MRQDILPGRWVAIQPGRDTVRTPVGNNFVIIDGSGNLAANSNNLSDDFQDITRLLETDLLTNLRVGQTISYGGLLIRKVPDSNNPGYFKIYMGKRGYPLEDLLRDILRFLAMNTIIVLPFYFMARYFVRKTLEPVEENMNAMSHFIHDAGHELKTPLAIISGNLQILRDSKKPEKDLIENSIATISSMSDSLG